MNMDKQDTCIDETVQTINPIDHFETLGMTIMNHYLTHILNTELCLLHNPIMDVHFIGESMSYVHLLNRKPHHCGDCVTC